MPDPSKIGISGRAAARARAARFAFFGYFAATILLLGWILRPFLTTLLVAAVISVWLAPIQAWATHHWQRPRLVALLLTVGFVVVVLVPVTLVVVQAVGQVGHVVADVSSAVRDARGFSLERLGFFQRIAELAGLTPAELQTRVQTTLGEGLSQVATILTRTFGDLLGATATAMLQLFILLFAIFTFLTSGETILERFKRISPLDDELEEELLRIFRGLSRGLALGAFLTAALQGLIAAVGYRIVGIDQVVFWGLLTAMFSFVPVVGTALVWGPLAISLLLGGASGKALFLVLYSVLLTGGVDNFLKPWLIGQHSSLPPLLLFLSIFGGLLTLGGAGVLIGPVTASFFLALADVYVQALEGESPISAAEAEASDLAEEPSDPV